MDLNLVPFIKSTQEMSDRDLQKAARCIVIEQQRRAEIMRARVVEASIEYTRTQAPDLSYPISSLLSEEMYEEGLIIS